MHLSFKLSGSFQNTLEKLKKISFCLLSSTAHSSQQLLLIVSLKPRQMSEENISPYLQKEFMSNEIQDSCSRALEQLPQSSLSVWIAIFCDVFGAQICPLTCFCLIFSHISDPGFWTVKEMGRLTKPLGSAHLCGTANPTNVKVLRLGAILALLYRPQHRTASQDNFNFLRTCISTLIREDCLLAIHMGQSSVGTNVLYTLHWNAEMRFRDFKYLRIFVQQCKH